MAVATFDMLKFANTLKAASVPDKQAEAQATAFAEVIQINLKELVTKDDLVLTKQELLRESNDLRKDIKREMNELEQRLDAKIDTVKAELRGELILIRWMLGVMVACIVGILVRLFIYRGGF
jgi:hypothetical protein